MVTQGKRHRRCVRHRCQHRDRTYSKISWDSTDDLKTPLTAQLDNLGTRFAQAILGVSLILLFLGRVIHDMAPSSLLSNILSFAVATVPEGLPALVTITLALGVQQMATHNAITRKMGAVETLGAVTDYLLG